MHSLAQSVLAYIRKHDLLRPGDRVAVAVSGGADSVALLRLTIELQDELGIIVSVVHLNHKLRGAESDSDEQFVRELAKTHHLEITCESRDVNQYAAEKNLSLEAAAREVRYEFFRRMLHANVNRIATAHTLDDQAETVLLKLARGAGTRGWAGIYPRLALSHQLSAIRKPWPQAPVRNEPSIVRPLLGTRRSELRYLLEIGQDWREDSSNQELRYTRNRIRHQVLPFLEREFNSSLSNVLADTAEIARAEEEYWSAEVLKLLPQTWRGNAAGGKMSCAPLRALPRALQRRLIRAAAESIGLQLEFRHVEGILGLQKEGDCVTLPGEWVAAIRNGEIAFSRARDDVTSDYEYPLTVPGRVAVPESEIEIEALVCSGEDENQKYTSEHLVGAAFLSRGLVVRNWRAGERFWPAHTKEPRKIKELLQDKHITGERKKLWPIVASGDEIVWLRGFGVRRDFQANNACGILIREAGTKPDVRVQKPNQDEWPPKIQKHDHLQADVDD